MTAGHDGTGRWRGEEELRRINAALYLLSLCNHAVIHAEDEKQLLREICQNITRAGAYAMAWIGIKRQECRNSPGVVPGAGQTVRVTGRQGSA